MAITQNTHLHPLAWVKNPPATGPTTGPSKGPIAQIAIDLPRFSCTIISAIVPPPIVNGADPTHPSRKRNPINMPRLLLTAQTTVKITNSTLQAW